MPRSFFEGQEERTELCLSLIKDFLEAHGYKSSSPQFSKVTSNDFKRHCDPVSHGVLAQFEQPEHRDAALFNQLLRVSDYLQLSSLRQGLLTLIASEIYLDCEDEKEIESYRRRHGLPNPSDEERQLICREHKDLFLSLRK